LGTGGSVKIGLWRRGWLLRARIPGTLRIRSGREERRSLTKLAIYPGTQTGHLNFNINYTFSKALGILGSAADFNWTAAVNPFQIQYNYKADELRSLPGLQRQLLLFGR
jgi:hypothetical protein